MERFGIQTQTCPNCEGQGYAMLKNDDETYSRHDCGFCTDGNMDVRQHDNYAEYINSKGNA